jgi:hypothetical protein
MFISVSLFCLYMALHLQSPVLHSRWIWHEQNCGMISGDCALTLSVEILQLFKMLGFSCHVA